ncbi:wD repeat domain [Beauveria asiatica]|uniref:Mitochondrial division protein 1 n=1 Tax=Beauveria asiatica TaxID=1069075 RepID=A0AAW0S574_9HYPO
MARKRNGLKGTWAALKSSLCSTRRDTARSSEASPQAAQSQPHITPSVPTIGRLANSTEGGGDSSCQAEAVPVPEQGSASFTKQSDKLSYELWNKAYDELEKAESELVGNYAKVLAKALAEVITEARHEEARDDSVGHSDERKYVKDLTARVLVELNVPKAKAIVDEAPPGSNSAELDEISTSVLAKLKDPAKRQMFLEMLVSRGQLKVKRTEGIAKAAGYVAEKAAPAALPWAGICLGLKMLSYPADSAQEQRDGFSFVAHRMQWYYAMTDHLLDHDNKPSTGQDSASILEMLTEKLFDLYKAILRYQLLSVCYYYSNPFRQLYDNVDWAGSKKAVEDAECVFSKDWDCYKKVEARNLWEDIGQTLQNYVSQQNARLLTHENREYLQALWVGDPQDEMNDIEDKKGALYDNMCEWMLSHPNYKAFTAWDEDRSRLGGRLLWIKGPAGIGKTMVMICIVRNLLKQRRVQNLAYFFCQSAKKSQNTATTIVRALLWMLLIQQPNLITHIQTKFQWAGKDMFEKGSTIRGFLEVFENISKDASPVYLFVDALDECDEGQKEIIRLIAASLRVSKNVRWLITSRTEVELLDKVTSATTNASVVLDEIDVLAQTGRDEMYIQHKLSALKEQPGLEYGKVDCEQLKKAMQERAEGNLLWLAVVFDSIKEMRAEYAQEEIKNAPRGVKELYDHKIRQIQNMKKEERQRCYDVLMVVSLAYSLPISLAELEVLVPWSARFDPLVSLRKCSAFLMARYTKQRKTIIDVNHKTVKDYIIEFRDSLRGNAIRGHADLVRHSIDALSSEKRDVFKLGRWKSQIPPPLELNDLACIRYSLVYWLDHLCEAINHSDLSEGKALCEAALEFLKPSVRSHADAESDLFDFLTHAEKFTVMNMRMITQEPLQTYGTALAFCPKRCKMRELFWGSQQFPLLKSVKGIKDDWDFSLIQELRGHTSRVEFLAFSCDGMLASASPNDKTVRIWDFNLWREAKILCKGLGRISDIAFSHDGKQLAAVWNGPKVKFWNLLTGEEADMHSGHSSYVNALAFSRDGTLASASYDRTVRIRDPAKPDTMKILTGHTDSVFAIEFSRDGKQLASASHDNTVRLWDPATASESRSFSGFKFRDRRDIIAFMADGKDLLVCSDGNITRYSVATGARTQLLNHPAFISTFALSPDCTQLAAVTGHTTFELFDLKTGDALQGLRIGGMVRYSPDGKTLASAYVDNVIRLWDSTLTSTVAMPSSKASRSHGGLTFSPDGDELASSSADGSVRIRNPSTGTEIVPPLRGHSIALGFLVYSPNGAQLLSVDHHNVFMLWNAAAGYEFERRFVGRPEVIVALDYSVDGKQIISASMDGAVRLWDPATGLGRLAFNTHRIRYHSPWCLNGKQMASSSSYDIEVWDLDKDLDSPVWGLDLPSDYVSVAAFSPDGTQLVGLSRSFVYFFDAATGAVAGATIQLPAKYDMPRILGFSDDGRMLYTNRGSVDIRPLPLEKAASDSATLGEAMFVGLLNNIKYA